MKFSIKSEDRVLKSDKFYSILKIISHQETINCVFLTFEVE